MSTRKIPCATQGCGKLLVVPEGFQILHGGFPEDLESIAFFLSSGTNKIFCEQCRRPTPCLSAGLCTIQSGRYAIAYLPSEWANENPDLVEKTRQQMREVSERAGWRTRVVTENKL